MVQFHEIGKGDVLICESTKTPIRGQVDGTPSQYSQRAKNTSLSPSGKEELCWSQAVETKALLMTMDGLNISDFIKK